MPPPLRSRPPGPLRAAALGLLLLGLAGCRKAPPAPLTYAGSGTISDSVLPGLIEGFVRQGGVPFQAVENIGSTPGFKRVMAGGASVAGVARSLRSVEKAQHPYYVIFAYDALAIFVHPGNPVPSLSRSQLKALFTGQVTNWKALGGPDLPVALVTMDLSVGSGTVELFRDGVMEGAAFAPTTQVLQVDELVARVARTPGAVAWGSLSTRAEGVRRVPVEGVAPTPESVRTADYPLSRSLVLVSREVPGGPLKAFLDYVMSPAGQAVVAERFVPVHAPR